MQAPGSDSSFQQCVDAVIAVRLANPRFNLPTDRATVEGQVDYYNASRYSMIANAGSYIVQDGGPAPNFQLPRPQSRLAAAGAVVGKFRTGAKLLTDWLGTGGQPVSVEAASARAAVCVDCPRNSLTELTRLVSMPVAMTIKKMLETRQELKLATPHDEKLGVCEVCLCSNRLKPFVPLEFIQAHTKPEVLAEFPAACWIVNEISKKELTAST